MKTIIGLFCAISVVACYTPDPIIGLLSQEAYAIERFFPGEKYDSFIAASYVKFLESAGARVVPIWIGQSREYYRKVIEKTNGLLLPGGATWFNQSDGYADAGQMLYDIALEYNQKGDYYPIWSICLGMELLAQVAVGGQELRAHCSSVKENLPLKFRPGYETSKIFRHAPKDIIKIFRTLNVTYNYHQFCVTEQNFTLFGLDKDWNIVSTNKDVNGMEFISVFESKRHPFYAVQFHPEKTNFEFKDSLKIFHSKEATQVSQYLSTFFVEETRQSNHQFDDWLSEQKSLIYNYPPQFIGIKNSSYIQVYVFKEKDYVDYY